MKNKTEEGRLVWITGLAGTGKTTLGYEVYKAIKKKYPNTVFLDGDKLREILDEETSHDISGRKRTAKIYSGLCSCLTNQGINVVISTISLFHEIYDYNRKNNKDYYEILLHADEEVVKERKKEVYKNKENIMGVHQTPEFPKNPSIILKNNTLEELSKNVKGVIKLLKL